MDGMRTEWHANGWHANGWQMNGWHANGMADERMASEWMIGEGMTDKRMTGSRSVKAVIFDMDGLMFDTERIAAGCWRQAGQERGIEIGEEFLKYVRGSSKEQVAPLFERLYGPGFWEVRGRKEELFHGYLDTHEVPVKKGLRELLQYLRREDYRIVLATSTQKNYAFSYLESTGVKPFFDDFVCGDMVKRAKPDPEIFLKAAELAGAKPEECVVLEDSFNGIMAASAGGFIPIMVPDLTIPDEALMKLLAARCESLLDVIGVLEAWAGKKEEL